MGLCHSACLPVSADWLVARTFSYSTRSMSDDKNRIRSAIPPPSTVQMAVYMFSLMGRGCTRWFEFYQSVNHRNRYEDYYRVTSGYFTLLTRVFGEPLAQPILSAWDNHASVIFCCKGCQSGEKGIEEDIQQCQDFEHPVSGSPGWQET